MTWLDVIERLYPIVAGLLGVGLFEIVRFFWFAKSDKKGKDIENKGKEIDNEGKAIDNESKEINEYRKLIDTLQDSLIKQREYYEQFINSLIKRSEDRDKRVDDKFKEVFVRFEELKTKSQINEESVAEAYRCPYPDKVDDCPVIKKHQQLSTDCSDCTKKKNND